VTKRGFGGGGVCLCVGGKKGHFCPTWGRGEEGSANCQREGKVSFGRGGKGKKARKKREIVAAGPGKGEKRA